MQDSSCISSNKPSVLLYSKYRSLTLQRHQAQLMETTEHGGLINNLLSPFFFPCLVHRTLVVDLELSMNENLGLLFQETNESNFP